MCVWCNVSCELWTCEVGFADPSPLRGLGTPLQHPRLPPCQLSRSLTVASGPRQSMLKVAGSPYVLHCTGKRHHERTVARQRLATCLKLPQTPAYRSDLVRARAIAVSRRRGSLAGHKRCYTSPLSALVELWEDIRPRAHRPPYSRRHRGCIRTPLLAATAPREDGIKPTIQKVMALAGLAA